MKCTDFGLKIVLLFETFLGIFKQFMILFLKALYRFSRVK